MSPQERAKTLVDAAATDPQAAQAPAQAAADTLTAMASTVEGRRGGPLTEAAEMFDKAVRAINAKVAKATSRSSDMRAMARLIRLMGRIYGDEDTFALLALVLDMARLGDTLASWRNRTDAWHQVQGAREAAAALRAWHDGGVPAIPRPVAPVTVPSEPVSEQASQAASATRRRTNRKGGAR